MTTQRSKKILLAPLDWGIGHTTRCVPIIDYLLQSGHRVYVAGNSRQLDYYTATFGKELDQLPLEGYNVTYSAINRFAQIGLLGQMPGILRAIQQERKWLKQVVADIQPDGIISDNRYGLYHKGVASVLITHQLRVMSGMGSRADDVVQQLHYRMLRHYNHIWVPDLPTAPGLAGALSHPERLPASCSYIGPLSRLERGADSTAGRLLILLSGPEPQRTILANILWQQACALAVPTVFVEGSPQASRAHVPSHIEHHSVLTHKELQPIVRAAHMVICRSGYSTIMDLVAMGKRAILIPTPAQTEQQYLARMLHKQHLFMEARQQGFNLEGELARAARFEFADLPVNKNFRLFEPEVDKWINELN